MNFKNEQKRMDDLKWYDSIVAGEDRCGTYDFCSVCKKEEEYPCAHAEYRYRNGLIRIAIIRRHK